MAVIYIFVDKVWYAGHSFLFSNDTRLPLDMKTQDDTFFYLWSSNIAPGVFDAIKLAFLAPVGILIKLFYLVSIPLNPSIYQKIVNTLLIFFSLYSFYYLMSSIAPSIGFISKVIGSFIYAFNFFSLFLWIGLTPITFRYAFFPLILGYYIKRLNSKNIKIIYTSSALALLYTVTITPAYQTIPFVILDFLFLLLYLSYYLYLNIRDRNKVKIALLFSFTTFGLWLLLNAFLIIPLLYGFTYTLQQSTNSPVESYRDSNALFSLNSTRVVDSIRLMGYWAFGGWWRGMPYYHWFKPFLSNPLLAFSFAVPVISFLALLQKKYRQLILFFGLTLTIFVFFIKGPHEPFGELNQFIFNHFQLNALFRSGYQRFMGYIALSLIVLFTFGLDVILGIKKKKLPS